MNEQLPELHALCLKIDKFDFKQRLSILCEYFLNYKYGPWQIGSSIEALDDFNYDLQTLDCVTYSEVVLALVKSDPNTSYDNFKIRFENLLRHIHYKNGSPSFLASNHVFCVDWIENNKFIIEDMTRSLTPNVKIAETTIDRLGYFKKHRINANNDQNFSEYVQQQLPTQISILPYIETEELLNNHPNYVNTFPEYCIVTIVRPNWDLTERIGTHLNISHLGFAIKDHDRNNIKFFHATIEKMLVIQETLDIYMQRHRDSPTIRGVNTLAISPGYYNIKGTT